MYMLRLWKNAQWETVVVDDFFPVLDNKFKPTKCAGAAFAYSSNFEELWVPLIEKAFAKYHGGYASLEAGTVPMGLTDLTGGPSEEVRAGSGGGGVCVCVCVCVCVRVWWFWWSLWARWWDQGRGAAMTTARFADLLG
jgi:hypothetical protein